MVSINFKPMILLLVLFLTALFVGGVYVYSVFIAALFLILVTYLTGKSTHKNLVHIIWKSGDKIQSGETIELVIEFYNSGFFPVPYFKLNANLPKRLVEEQKESVIYSIEPGSKLEIKSKLKCNYKGIYQINRLMAEFGDAFGFFKWRRSFEANILICVYPKITTLRHFSIPARQNFGTVAVRHNAYEDFASIKDIRQYAAGDSFKKIHWKVTSHRGEFYVKNVDFNATADLHVFLDLYRNSYINDSTHDMEEKGAECAASIIRYALSKHMSVDYAAKSDKFINVSGTGLNRMPTFLDAITQYTVNGDIPIWELVKKEAQKLNFGASAVIITPQLEDRALDLLFSLKAKGIEFVIIYLCENHERLDKNIEILKVSGFKVYVVSAHEGILHALGGNDEK